VRLKLQLALTFLAFLLAAAVYVYAQTLA